MSFNFTGRDEEKWRKACEDGRKKAKEKESKIHQNSSMVLGCKVIGHKLGIGYDSGRFNFEMTRQIDRNEKHEKCKSCGAKASIDEYFDPIKNKHFQVIRCQKKAYGNGRERAYPCAPYKREKVQSEQAK